MKVTALCGSLSGDGYDYWISLYIGVIAKYGSQSLCWHQFSYRGGFKALLDYVDYNDKLEWVITENVHTLTQCRQKFGNECPINIQNRAMEQRGFVPAHALACSSKFGVPQSRSRCWGLYIKAGCLKAFAPDPCKLFVSLGSIAPSNVLDGNLACLAAPSGRKAIQDENSLKFWNVLKCVDMINPPKVHKGP